MITPIGLNNTNNISTDSNIRNGYIFKTQPYSYDCVSFTSGNLLLKSSKEINKAVVEAIRNKENCLGKGREGVVYKIPDSEYCVKLNFQNMDNTFAAELQNFLGIRSFGEWNKSISSADKVNHIVAKTNNGAVLMKQIKGSALEYFNKPEEIYTLPEEAYKSLVKQMTDARKHGMNFDSAPSNIMYDPDSKTLTAIDFYDEDELGFTPISSVFSVLSNRNKGKEDLNKKLAGRLLSMSLNEIKKGKDSDIPIEGDDIKELFYNLEYMVKPYNLPSQYKFLKTSVDKIFELRKLERRGEDVQNEMNGELKYSKCIINQIFLSK